MLEINEWMRQLKEYAETVIPGVSEWYPIHDFSVWEAWYWDEYSPVEAFDEDMTYWED